MCGISAVVALDGPLPPGRARDLRAMTAAHRAPRP